jgi:hypothetical protein
MKTVIFVGPTLPVEVVRALAPDAEIRPPAAVGEILDLALARRRPTRIALIDGYFERMAAVWHKELLVAIERGIACYGAASMGALRAAELAPFGMIGVGAIYKAFVSGELTRDDEVAVAHLPAAQHYKPISDALVNIRATLEHAPNRARLIALAQRRFYRERTWAQLVADAGPLARSLQAWLAKHPPIDRKAADAKLLLSRLAKPAPMKKRVRVPRTWALRQLIANR